MCEKSPGYQLSETQIKTIESVLRANALHPGAKKTEEVMDDFWGYVNKLPAKERQGFLEAANEAADGFGIEVLEKRKRCLDRFGEMILLRYISRIPEEVISCIMESGENEEIFSGGDYLFEELFKDPRHESENQIV